MTPRFITATLALAALGVACTTASTTKFPVCEVALMAVAPEAAAPGDVVVLTATPLSEAWDTALMVGGVRAPVLAVDRVGCEACDTCRDDEACEECGDCDACDATCAQECVETVTFQVPDLPEGTAWIELFNAHGGSDRLSIEVTPAAEDTGGG